LPKKPVRAAESESRVQQKFAGGVPLAPSLGAPPHGGIATGVDRIVILLCGEENLREVVVISMNQRAEDLLTGAQSEVTPCLWKHTTKLDVRMARGS
jgi:aspartyl-tRNA synthetase